MAATSRLEGVWFQCRRESVFLVRALRSVELNVILECACLVLRCVVVVGEVGCEADMPSNVGSAFKKKCQTRDNDLSQTWCALTGEY